MFGAGNSLDSNGQDGVRGCEPRGSAEKQHACS